MSELSDEKVATDVSDENTPDTPDTPEAETQKDEQADEKKDERLFVLLLLGIGGRQGRRRVEKYFSFDHTMNEIMSVYDRVLSIKSSKEQTAWRRAA